MKSKVSKGAGGSESEGFVRRLEDQGRSDESISESTLVNNMEVNNMEELALAVEIMELSPKQPGTVSSFWADFGWKQLLIQGGVFLKHGRR
jgi:hypothetical protein